MPLRRTKRSDGRQRPRWKDGSHAKVENTDADQSRCNGLAFEHESLDESLEHVRSLLDLNREPRVSTRDRPARTGADARIEGSVANGEVRLATQPYGRKNKLRFQLQVRLAKAVSSQMGGDQAPILGTPVDNRRGALYPCGVGRQGETGEHGI